MLIATYIQMNLFFLLLLTLILIHSNRAKYGRAKEERLLYNTHIATIMAAIVLDALGWAINGMTFAGAYHLNYIVNTLTFLLNPVLTIAWFLFIIYKLNGRLRLFSSLSLFAGLTIITNTLICLLNFQSRFYFYIDAANVYHRGNGFWFMPALLYFYTFLSTVFAARKFLRSRGDADARRTSFMLMIYTWPSTIGGVLQTMFYGIVGTWMATTFSVCLYYFYDTMFRLEKMQKLENDLVQSQISITLSQIRPHFLYNTLTAIADACEPAPKAQQAIINFAKYLRGNLDTLSDNKAISFEKELAHIETYLKLEKLRFEDKLNIVYDIRQKDFVLPALTVQPLVENAVKHGVGKKKGGGTVMIATTKTDSDFVVTVSDDGVGFDAKEKESDSENHVGIKNITQRLDTQCGGTLEITSAIGAGTTAKITIPKGAKA